LGFETGKHEYIKEYALGRPLELHPTLKRMLVPELKKFGKSHLDNEMVSLENNVFCEAGSGSSNCCEFIRGFMAGFLDSNKLTKNTSVQKQTCIGEGKQLCLFSFSN